MHLNLFKKLFDRKGVTSDWCKPLKDALKDSQNNIDEYDFGCCGTGKETDLDAEKSSNDDTGATRAANSGTDLTCLRPADSVAPALHGTTGILTRGLKRSMEEEFSGTEFWEEYDYVVNQPAREGGPPDPTYQFSSLNEGTVRDEGHEGWTLSRFAQHDRAKAAQLSLAEVAALRLYTSPWFAAVNRALRTGENVEAWATTISLIISGILKLSIIDEPKVVYRALKGSLAKETTIGCAHIDPGILSGTDSVEVACSYAGDPHIPAVLLCIETTFGSRPGFLDNISQSPMEREYLFPPFTVLEILDIEHYGKKTLVRVRPTLSMMRHYTIFLRYPWTSPNDPLTWDEYDVIEKATQSRSQENVDHEVKDTKFSSDAADLITGAPKIAALGLETYMNQSLALPTLPADGVSKIEQEFMMYGTELDKKWFHYIMHQPATPLEDDWGLRDGDRNGERLGWFHEHPDTKGA